MTPATPEIDPRDKKKFYFADTPQRRAMIAIVRSLFNFKRFPRRARVQIKLLPPIFPKPAEHPLALTDRLMFTLARSLPEKMPESFAI